jgi:hypothetical protein
MENIIETNVRLITKVASEICFRYALYEFILIMCLLQMLYKYEYKTLLNVYTYYSHVVYTIRNLLLF